MGAARNRDHDRCNKACNVWIAHVNLPEGAAPCITRERPTSVKGVWRRHRPGLPVHVSLMGSFCRRPARSRHRVMTLARALPYVFDIRPSLPPIPPCSAGFVGAVAMAAAPFSWQRVSLRKTPERTPQLG